MNGQTPAKPSFEAASIRPHDRATDDAWNLDVGPGRYHGAATLLSLMMFGYQVERYQITGGPPWNDSDYYNVEAATSAPSTRDEIRIMIQRLLADRFQLKLHRETRITPADILVLDAKGIKSMTPSPAGTPRDGGGSLQFGLGEIRAHGLSMSSLASFLTDYLGRPVVDQTGLDGIYDFRVPNDDSGTRLDQAAGLLATMKSLGLRVTSGKAPIEYIVIDHAEKPSPN